MRHPESVGSVLLPHQLATFVRRGDHDAFLAAVAAFRKKYPDGPLDAAGAKHDDTAALSALLRYADGDGGATGKAAAAIAGDAHAVEGEPADAYAYTPDPNAKLAPTGDGHAPDFLAIAPVARTLQRPAMPVERAQLHERDVDGALAMRSGFNVDRLAYPWCCIGKVRVAATYRFPGIPPITLHKSGTGAMIGRNLMITAAHVMPSGASSWTVEFIPALSGNQAPGAPFGSAFVTTFRQHSKAKAVTGYDIAICRLDRPMGDLTGWFGHAWSSDDDFYYDASFFSAGYPGAYYHADEMLAEYNIKVRDIDGDSYDGKEIETDAFSNKGWSGGPLFSWFRDHPFPLVAGVLSGREKDFLDPTRSVFVGGRRLVDLVNYGHAHWG